MGKMQVDSNANAQSLSCIPRILKYTPIEATKFSSFKLLVSNSLGPFPERPGALGMS